MIFITLGSQKFQFNRLLKAVDKLVKNGVITEEVFAQIGYSDYEPQNYMFKHFLDRDEFADIVNKSDIVITHGGTGAIISAVKQGKKVIAVPRVAEYNEHVDNHQRQLATQFANMDLICKCDDCDKLGEALEYVKSRSFPKYVSNTDKIIESIDKFLSGGNI